MSAFRAAIHLRETAGIDRPAADVRLGVPLARGVAVAVDSLVLLGEGRKALPCQFTVLAKWPDGSIKWVLLDFLAPCPANAAVTIHLADRTETTPAATQSTPQLRVVEDDSGVRVIAASHTFCLLSSGETLMKVEDAGGAPAMDARGVQLCLSKPDGTTRRADITSLALENAGPVRVDILTSGRVVTGRGKAIEFRARWIFTAGVPVVRCHLLVRNPARARHVGGLWDLGDQGSCLIKDLSLRLTPRARADRLQWRTEGLEDATNAAVEPLYIYQDSSGGDRWDSPNHLDASGRLGVVFRGYEVRSGDQAGRSVLAKGLRAQPVLSAVGPSGSIAVTVEKFWQEFPKALRWEDDSLSLGLFPRERVAPVELQGGEQKRHRVLLEFADSSHASRLPQLVHPVHAWTDPAWVQSTGAVPGFVVSLEDHSGYRQYLARIIEGEHAFLARRELIDEYGWRNFGDLYADHEAVHAAGRVPFVSHYNNQYDFIHGAGYHALRTGDPRWWQLMDEGARHTVDIDIYHTQEDKPAFNGGLFWHTDHYKPAATATHRTYSRRNRGLEGYGGGPSNEHNYTSGLTLHHYLTGDPDSRESAIGLADWVLAMEDGRRTLLGLLDPGPTGLASKTESDSYHGPGRGAGNSINALLDGYALTGRRRYMEKAEELLQRCIHPRDDIAALCLDEPEHRWSYLVFLQVMGRYLNTKLELREHDYTFQYAREALLHYGRWMLAHEKPYRDVLHKVLLPTETWPAHDIRKCHVLHLAACFGDEASSHQLRSRASWFYERCLADLGSFETAGLTRPLVLLCVFGHWQAYFQQQAAASSEPARFLSHGYDFGEPVLFVAQQKRALGSFRVGAKAGAAELGSLVMDRLGRWRQALEGRRG